jgi:Tol biopolymer transport system component
MIAFVMIDGYPWSDEAISEVRVVSSSGGRPVVVSREAARLRSPVWSPDGTTVAFLSEVDRGMEIRFVPVSAAGEPLEPERAVPLPRFSHHLLAGWTPEEKIGIPITTPEYQATYTVPVEGGRALQVSPRGEVYHPRWSPDGERIYFRWKDGRIAYVPAEGGEVTVLEQDRQNRVVEVTSGGGNDISPDGQSIVFAAYRAGVMPVREQIWLISIDGGEPHELFRGTGGSRFPCWSPDGQTIAFLRGREVGGAVSFDIWTVPVRGGEAERLSGTADLVDRAQISWSPDGNSIAYFSKGGLLKTISLSTASSTEIAKVGRTDSHNELAWSPDGREIVYTSSGRIWRVSVLDGLPREIESGVDGSVTHIDWSPDGETLVFTASTGGKTVLVMMEDFLPAQEIR